MRAEISKPPSAGPDGRRRRNLVPSPIRLSRAIRGSTSTADHADSTDESPAGFRIEGIAPSHYGRRGQQRPAPALYFRHAGAWRWRGFRALHQGAISMTEATSAPTADWDGAWKHALGELLQWFLAMFFPHV